jgi:pyrroline-5-carboxylate reductase
MQNTRIAIIGGGNIGIAIAQGLLRSNTITASNICITRRRVHLIESYREKGVEVLTNNKEAVSRSQIIILAIKPYQIKSVLEEIQPVLDPEKHIVISVVTGMLLKEIATITGEVPVFRAMPNTAMAINESMTCVASYKANGEHQEKVLAFFRELGKAIIINEELMDAATVLGACGIAFALRFMRAAMQGGIEIGFGSELSQFITAQTLMGASKLILESGHHPEKEIDKVTTPQGITISGLNEMEHQGFSSALIKGLLTSFNKLKK